jgi:hypothetical protein
MFSRIQRRLRYGRDSSQRAQLLREEMDTHLAMKTRGLMEEGMSEPEATRTARAQFGNSTLQQEESRSMWIAQWLSDAIQDVAFALRTSASSRGLLPWPSTSAPSSASASAVAAPSPREPPVTSATFPANIFIGVPFERH